MSIKDDVNYIKNELSSEEKFLESFVKTERFFKKYKKLIVVLIIAERNKADTNIILDLFGGSGSTLITCEQLNKKNLTMEMDEHYCDLIINRWETLTGRKAVKIG